MRGLQLEGAPQAKGLVGQAGVGWVQIVVAKRARATERRCHRIADPPALEHGDPPDPLRRVIRREQPHDAASDHEEVAVTVEALAAPDAHALLARLRERAPLSWVPALDGWLVVRRDLALHVMGDAATFTVDDPRFSTGRVVGPSMLTLDGDEHQRHRAPFARPFRLQPVRERFTDVVADEVERLVDAIEPDGAAELRRAFAGPLAAAIVTHSLGLPEADTGAVLGWYDAIVAAVTEVTAGGEVPAAGRAAFAELQAAIGPALDRGPARRCWPTPPAASSARRSSPTPRSCSSAASRRPRA